MRLILNCRILLLCVFFLPAVLSAQPLRTGMVVYPPFGIDDNDGICPNIWLELAARAQLTYELHPQRNVAQTLEAVSRGDLDMAIGPISITSARLENLAFTLPFYRSEVGLLIPEDAGTMWAQLRPFFRIAALTSLGVLILILFIVGNLMWLVERRQNPDQFPSNYLTGIGNGMWFALVTLTTVGYGDRAPVTPAGRIIAGIWMVVSMVTVSSFIASMASAFTISFSNIQSETFNAPEDLKGRRVAVVTGTTSAQWATHHKARPQETASLNEAVALLRDQKVEAVVFGKPLLRYYLKQHPDQPFKLADLSLASEDYGFAFPINSPHLHPVNLALKQLQEEGRIQKIIDTWLD